MFKSIGPLEGMTIGAKIGRVSTIVPEAGNATGAFVGCVAGGLFGLGKSIVQSIWPDRYDKWKNSVYQKEDNKKSNNKLELDNLTYSGRSRPSLYRWVMNAIRYVRFRNRQGYCVFILLNVMTGLYKKTDITSY
ncbi:hypothetical protein [Enterococcus mundtii]|uniref:hypothetical protein n=1 Tax=Enterococcus mundtii TaxID=53346 RepID=UPI00115820AE|nr:hypothetical protein [Enterococcus mundtii]